MGGETRRAVRLQPDLLRDLHVAHRLPEGAELVFTGCGTSFHAVDIVRFQRLTLAMAEAAGIDPDRIHRDDERWARARAAYR